MQTETRNRWVGGFFKKKKLVDYLAGQKVLCYTSLLPTAINRISLLELDGCVCNLSWIHIGLDDKQLILICPDVDTSNTIHTIKNNNFQKP